jgi:hypothetical protein
LLAAAVAVFEVGWFGAQVFDGSGWGWWLGCGGGPGDHPMTHDRLCGVRSLMCVRARIGRSKEENLSCVMGSLFR